MSSPARPLLPSSSGDAGTSPELLLACAADLARAGRYQDAERLLAAIPEQFLPSQSLDLRARIAGQQRRHEEARAYWGQALLQDPTNAELQAVARAIERWCSPNLWTRMSLAVLGTPFRRVATAAMLLGAVLCALWSVDHVAPTLRPRAVSSPPVMTSATSIAPRESSVVRDARLDQLQVPGSAIRKLAAGVEVVFVHGLFSDGLTLTQSGREALTKLAGQLRPYGQALHVEIEGRADSMPVRPGGRFPTNSQLALARAEYVAVFLHSAGSIPLSRAALSASSEVDGSLSTPEKFSLAERTVVLRLVLHDG